MVLVALPGRLGVRLGLVAAILFLAGCGGSTHLLSPSSTATTGSATTGSATTSTASSTSQPPITGPVKRCKVVRQAPRSHALRSIGAGQLFTVKVLGPDSSAGSMRLVVLAANLIDGVPGRFAATGVTFTAPGQFLAIRVRVTNLGSGAIIPYHAIGDQFVLTGASLDTVLEAGLFDKTCAGALPSFTTDAGLALPYAALKPHQTEVTAALFPLPQAASVQRLAWTALALGVTIPIKSPTTVSISGPGQNPHGRKQKASAKPGRR
jgi:hypothetical protein